MLGQQVDRKAKSNDGFDGSICLVNKNTKTLQFSGARSSIFLLLEAGACTGDLGGSLNTKEFTEEVIREVKGKLNDG